MTGTVFVDSCAWFAAISTGDERHERARDLLSAHAGRLVTADDVLIESWLLTCNRTHRRIADELVGRIVNDGLAEVLTTSTQDLTAALRVGSDFADQDFSLVDRTSWAVMERYGIDEAISFDADFAVYRYGPGRRQAFTIHR